MNKLNSKNCYFGATNSIVSFCEEVREQVKDSKELKSLEEVGVEAMKFDEFITEMIEEESKKEECDVPIPFEEAFQNSDAKTKSKYKAIYNSLNSKYKVLSNEINNFKKDNEKLLEENRKLNSLLGASNMKSIDGKFKRLGK